MEDETPTATPFTIDSPEKAAWAADKILSARERLARVKAAATAAVEQAEHEVQDLEDRFLAELREWGRGQLPRGRRSLILPAAGAVLKYRATPAGWRVTDEGAARAWAHRHLPDAIKVTVRTSVSAAALKEYAASTGETPDGVERVAAGEAFDVAAPKE